MGLTMSVKLNYVPWMLYVHELRAVVLFPFANFYFLVITSVRIFKRKFKKKERKNESSLHVYLLCILNWSRTQRSTCLCILFAGIRGVCHHASSFNLETGVVVWLVGWVLVVVVVVVVF
jgi:hypothetical protein